METTTALTLPKTPLRAATAVQLPGFLPRQYHHFLSSASAPVERLGYVLHRNQGVLAHLRLGVLFSPQLSVSFRQRGRGRLARLSRTLPTLRRSSYRSTWAARRSESRDAQGLRIALVPILSMPIKSRSILISHGPPFSRRILIADDNEDAAETLAALLRLDSHKATVVHNGKQALGALAIVQPEVLLLDIDVNANVKLDRLFS